MTRSSGRYVLCVRNGSYRASLQTRKVYRVIKDPPAEARSLLRVVDESGEDYLFPRDLFVPIDLSEVRSRSTMKELIRPSILEPSRLFEATVSGRRDGAW